MRIEEDDKCKTAFRIRYSHFQYQVMPFGLFNALATFQRYFNKILAKKLNILIIEYIDNILINIRESGSLYMSIFGWVWE